MTQSRRNKSTQQTKGNLGRYNLSFRDPDGQLVMIGNRVLRAIHKTKSEFYKTILEGENWPSLSRFFVDTKQISVLDINGETKDLSLRHQTKDYDLWLEHKKVDPLIYPTEWSPEQFRIAANMTVEIQIELLKAGLSIKDASPFNIVFEGTIPRFVDFLSIQKYNPSVGWEGYGQFLQMFIGPMILYLATGVPPHKVLTCYPDGVPLSVVKKNTPIKYWRFAHILFGVIAQGILEARTKSAKPKSREKPGVHRPVSAESQIRLMKSLQKTINGISDNARNRFWSAYDNIHSYNADALTSRDTTLAKYFKDLVGKNCIDLGCNKGKYSKLLAYHGAKKVVSLDFDEACISQLVSSEKLSDKIYPGIIDLLNLPGGGGWNAKGLIPFQERFNSFDFVCALALIHHLALARNVPLVMVIDFIYSLADSGIIEYVPLSDPQITEMAREKEIKNINYSLDIITEFLESRGARYEITQIKSSKRKLLYFSKGAPLSLIN